jgi:mycothiol synthase
MTIAVHRWVEHQQQAVIALGNVIYATSPLGYQEWRIAADAHLKDSLRLVAYEEKCGQIVGYGCLWPIHQSNIRLHLAVHPRWQGRGIGSLLWEALREEVVRHQFSTVQARVWEARREAIRFLCRRGVIPVQYLPELHLTLTDADPSKLCLLRNKASFQGFGFTTLRHEQTCEPDWSTKLLDLLNDVWPDMPQMTLGPYNPEGNRPVLSSPVFSSAEDMACLITWPQAFFLAKWSEHYVGWSSLSRSAAGLGAISVGDTGVRPAFRRRGLASALKAETIVFAKQQGYRMIFSKTANPAMLAVNEAIGFRREEGEVRLVWDRRTTAPC